MGWKKQVRRALEAALRRRGLEVVERERLYDWQVGPEPAPGHGGSPLSAEAAAWLVPDHPRLRELQERYARFDPAVTTPALWTEGHVSPDDLRHFRGDNAYVWQLRGPNMNVMAYALAAYYAQSIDRRGLLDRLGEDDAFGNHTFVVGGRVVSRDLLDSIFEIYFLDRHLRLFDTPGLTVLDIGAGYGRLAHRMLQAVPGLGAYLCTDAFPASSFLCEYYLRFRGVADRGAVVPLDEVERVLAGRRVDLAVNIHSFSECRLPAIEWWVSRLARHRVRWLMIVPNPAELATNDGEDFGRIIEGHGYRRIAQEPMYGDPVVQEYAINPSQYYLFELGGA